MRIPVESASELTELTSKGSTTMKSWTIENVKSGMVLGTYEGETAAEALDAMAHDAGYKSHAAACEVTGEDGSELRVTAGAYQLHVTEWTGCDEDTARAYSSGTYVHDYAESVHMAGDLGRNRYSTRELAEAAARAVAAAPDVDGVAPVCRVDEIA
jgi:hypothetical protein